MVHWDWILLLASDPFTLLLSPNAEFEQKCSESYTAYSQCLLLAFSAVPRCVAAYAGCSRPWCPSGSPWHRGLRHLLFSHLLILKITHILPNSNIRCGAGNIPTEYDALLSTGSGAEQTPTLF